MDAEYPLEELNATIGHVIHMLTLIVRYLGIKLPYTLLYRGVYPYARDANADARLKSTRHPIFLDSQNFKRFTLGMGMLNYDIAYLCYTQGVSISMAHVTYTLRNLMAACQAPQLGV
ncbi:UV radiation resistance protein/autophagy-related protein 14 [Syncephalastrum racemosum]|uniref:Autophagy-related protein 14 n=1 Tax=Syncephalastrum racemosum TaxID=13706 RepID=A0A1X2GZZ4_SYNRA|nr:UV radiation resistance protein/autophagy-related protein 14 [Syncephalastrum racemosum]